MTTQRVIPEPFTIEFADETLARIDRRVGDYPWDDLPATDDWSLGVSGNSLRALADWWQQGYEWRTAEAAINRFSQFRTVVDSQVIHFVRERGSNPDNVPVVLLHGWPYSFVSLLPLIEQLAHPERFGGRTEDGVDVIVPSLPGFGFSTPLLAPMGPRRMAELVNGLMTDVLGYGRYVAQGGDWGGYIASMLGFHHAEHVAGIHVHSFMVRHDGAMVGMGQVGADDATDEERAFANGEQQAWASEGAYSLVQGTQTQSLAAAMLDSPVGTAGWIVEKFHRWSDRRARTFEELFTRDQLLTECMIYVGTGTFLTAAWIYAAMFTENSATLPPGRRVEVPVAIAAFPDPVFPPPPRIFVERSHAVAQWTEMPTGGHFPFLESRQSLIEDIQRFMRQLR